MHNIGQVLQYVSVNLASTSRYVTLTLVRPDYVRKERYVNFKLLKKSTMRSLNWYLRNPRRVLSTNGMNRDCLKL